MKTLKIRELTFEAAHYLANHPVCGVIHGHTYFIRDLEIFFDEEKFVDFALIKGAIRAFDHKFFIPQEHNIDWAMFSFSKLGIGKNTVETQGNPTVENISELIENSLLSIDGVMDVSFELYEGPNQGVCVVPDLLKGL